MKKTTTTLTINPELLELSKVNKINVSETLEEALLIKLGIQNEERKEVIQRLKKAEAEKDFCKKRLKEMDKEVKEIAETKLLEKIKRFKEVSLNGGNS